MRMLLSLLFLISPSVMAETWQQNATSSFIQGFGNAMNQQIGRTYGVPMPAYDFQQQALMEQQRRLMAEQERFLISERHRLQAKELREALEPPQHHGRHGRRD